MLREEIRTPGRKKRARNSRPSTPQYESNAALLCQRN